MSILDVRRALFEDIRLLYRSEQNSVAKLAHRLTAKSCWPSNLERQSVSLAHRVFKDYSRLKFKTNTADFVTIISNIWKIFNINTPNKGIRLNDELSHPLVNNDSRFQYLRKIVDWLDQWKTFPEKSGKLTTQTFTSLCHSCLALPKIVNHLTQNRGFYFVLSYFLQTDPLEPGCPIYGPRAGSGPRNNFIQPAQACTKTFALCNILFLHEQFLSHISIAFILGVE